MLTCDPYAQHALFEHFDPLFLAISAGETVGKCPFFMSEIVNGVAPHVGLLGCRVYLEQKYQDGRWDKDKERKLNEFAKIINYLQKHRKGFSGEAFREFIAGLPSYQGVFKCSNKWVNWRAGLVYTSQQKLYESLDLIMRGLLVAGGGASC